MRECMGKCISLRVLEDWGKKKKAVHERLALNESGIRVTLLTASKMPSVVNTELTLKQWEKQKEPQSLLCAGVN